MLDPEPPEGAVGDSTPFRPDVGLVSRTTSATRHAGPALRAKTLRVSEPYPEPRGDARGPRGLPHPQDTARRQSPVRAKAIFDPSNSYPAYRFTATYFVSTYSSIPS